MIIGLCGNAGVGKDTVADFMVRNHSFAKVALADPLKRIIKDVYAFTDEQLWGPSEMRNAPDERYLRKREENEFGDYLGDVFLTPRYALQQLGTEWGRDCYANTWIDYGLRTAKAILTIQRSYSAQDGLGTGAGYQTDRKVGVVISDVRFKNEIDAIHAAGGKVVRLVRKNRRLLEGAAEQHASESEQRELPDELFDHHFINNGDSLDLLEAATAGLVQTIRPT